VLTTRVPIAALARRPRPGTQLEGLLVWTTESVYEIKQFLPPETIFFQQLADDSADSLGKTVGLDILSLYEQVRGALCCERRAQRTKPSCSQKRATFAGCRSLLLGAGLPQESRALQPLECRGRQARAPLPVHLPQRNHLVSAHDTQRGTPTLPLFAIEIVASSGGLMSQRGPGVSPA